MHFRRTHIPYSTTTFTPASVNWLPTFRAKGAPPDMTSSVYFARFSIASCPDEAISTKTEGIVTSTIACKKPDVSKGVCFKNLLYFSNVRRTDSPVKGFLE